MARNQEIYTIPSLKARLAPPEEVESTSTSSNAEAEHNQAESVVSTIDPPLKSTSLTTNEVTESCGTVVAQKKLHAENDVEMTYDLEEIKSVVSVLPSTTFNYLVASLVHPPEPITFRKVTTEAGRIRELYRAQNGYFEMQRYARELKEERDAARVAAMKWHEELRTQRVQYEERSVNQRKALKTAREDRILFEMKMQSFKKKLLSEREEIRLVESQKKGAFDNLLHLKLYYEERQKESKTKTEALLKSEKKEKDFERKEKDRYRYLYNEVNYEYTKRRISQQKAEEELLRRNKEIDALVSFVREFIIGNGLEDEEKIKTLNLEELFAFLISKVGQSCKCQKDHLVEEVTGFEEAPSDEQMWIDSGDGFEDLVHVSPRNGSVMIPPLEWMNESPNNPNHYSTSSSFDPYLETRWNDEDDYPREADANSILFELAHGGIVFSNFESAFQNLMLCERDVEPEQIIFRAPCDSFCHWDASNEHSQDSVCKTRQNHLLADSVFEHQPLYFLAPLVMPEFYSNERIDDGLCYFVDMYKTRPLAIEYHPVAKNAEKAVEVTYLDRDVEQAFIHAVLNRFIDEPQWPRFSMDQFVMAEWWPRVVQSLGRSFRLAIDYKPSSTNESQINEINSAKLIASIVYAFQQLKMGKRMEFRR